MSLKDRRVTIQTVADKAGVSKKTVSRVLNREKGVNAATYDKVMEVVQTLGYTPNIAARSLAGNRSYTIALVYDDPTSDYMAGVQGGVLAVCRAQGYHLLLEPLDRASLSGDAPFGIRAVDGAILMPPLSDDDEVIARLTEAGVPVVLVSSGLDHGDVLHVGIDEREAARVMTRHLIDLGHRRIAFILGREGHAAARRRRQGFAEEMLAQGLAIDDRAILEGDFTFVSGMRAAERLLASGYDPTAVFASNDHMAAGVMAALHQQGVTVPGEISVAGFDGAEIAAMVWPPLTTMDQPLTALGEAAGHLLLERIGKGGTPPVPGLLEARLIEGGTTGLPARA